LVCHWLQGPSPTGRSLLRPSEPETCHDTVPQRMSVWVPRTPSRPLTWPLRRVSWRICRADISRRRRPFDPPGYQCSSRQEPDRNQSHRHALRQCAGHLAWGFILALGIIAALNQLHIAQNVLNAVLYAALAALAGIAVVAVGGGGIKAMSQRWEAAAARFDAEMLRIAAARNAPSLTDQAPGHARRSGPFLPPSNRHGPAADRALPPARRRRRPARRRQELTMLLCLVKGFV